MRKRNVIRIGALLVVLVLMGAILLAGCDNAGAGGGGGDDGGEASDPSEVEFDATYDALLGASANMEEPASTYVISAQLFYELFVGIIEAWDGQQGTYTYGEITITVTEENGVWIWTFTDTASDPDEVMVFRVEQTSSGWDFSWTINGDTYLDGSISSDGLTGDLTIYDPSTDTVLFTFEWGSGTTYDLQFTISVYDGGDLSETLVIETTLDGSVGTWVYTNIDVPADNADGFWPDL